jgi:hypothetical protein
MVVQILIVAGVIVVGLVYLYLAISMRIKATAAKKWPTVKGRIISCSTEEDAMRTMTGQAAKVYFIDISYEYTVNGTAFTGHHITFGKPHYDYMTATRISEKFHAESERDVYYDPNNPSEALLVPYAREAMPSLIPAIFFIAAGIIVAVIMILYS